MVFKRVFSVFIFWPLFADCIIKSPLITFTQTQTSSEKQMIGEDRILEKDGWLISSIKTSSAGSEVWKKDFSGDSNSEEDKNILMSLRTLAYLAPEIKNWKGEGFLAEGLDGKLKINPVSAEAGIREELSKKETRSRLENLISIANEHRTKAIASRLVNVSSKSSSKEEAETLRLHLERTWYRLVEKGEFYEKSPGKWARKE
ncbi:DUF1318 domain-containing protein [Leptospira gomenensis]|uniref:DUF1318 domain-containing protein n=1 Tax=Leptospira gomenensis TaxID=2484974 RepID=A0A5F1YF69_9LEPT|nr:DUF1318 domain-containing protein [Leptospira gomenensis]TGK36407.1 DUF1318 domain-containing protein [Leptospira gomenensis]TGK41936.1 DUF1318 domain-containing protein [Leptospira gomenensis]TGK49537.1 DUF1318 domain-containing protein [Leptospira gomenensis]TGK67586.1 DUF1318 domain-containing protein [Leptospira gomenensis]